MKAQRKPKTDWNVHFPYSQHRKCFMNLSDKGGLSSPISPTQKVVETKREKKTRTILKRTQTNHYLVASIFVIGEIFLHEISLNKI